MKPNRDFPLLNNRQENGHRLVYLDNAATTQKPTQVLQAVADYYAHYTANPHRGAYALSADATRLYEQARERVAGFINARSAEEIVFTAGTTEAINLVAQTYGADKIHPGDEILLSIMEHHSNLLPWQSLARRKGAKLVYMYTDKQGHILPGELDKLNSRTKMVAITHVSNVLGSINPVAEITAKAHGVGAVVLMDAAQSAPHMPLDVAALGVDFAAFSGHKMLAPAGIGVLYGKAELLSAMRPLMLGGGMVEKVGEQSVSFMDAPWKFEGGTPNVEGAVGLAAAMDYIDSIGFDNIAREETALAGYALERMKRNKAIEIYGDTGNTIRAGIISFNVKGIHPHDTASILDAYGIAVRAGHHCAQPLMKWMGVQSTCRLSLYIYNTFDDVDAFLDALPKVSEVLGHGA